MADKIIVAGTIEGEGYDSNLEYNRRVYATEGIAPACKGMGGGGHETKIADPTAYDEQNGYFRKDGTVGALTTDGSSPKHNNRVVETSFRIRKLTPRECFRLMDFDDEDFDRAKAAGVSETQLYKQAGNSIVVAVLEAIFKQML